MKLFLPVSLLLSALIVLFSETKPEFRRDKEREKHSPQEPYENFMIARTYPNKSFDYKAYQTALNFAIKNSNTKLNRTSTINSWQLEGPGNIGGRFNCIAVNPLDSNVMYVGSANGGVWKTTDNANSWIPIFDSIPFQPIGAIAINPTDTNEIWVGTGDLNISGTMYLGNDIYKSIDAGHTWSYIGLGNTFVVSSIIFNPSNANEVVVGTMGNSFAKDNNRGIYKTSNGGGVFTQTKFVNDSTGIIDMVQDPSNPSILYASSFTRMRTELRTLTMGTETYVYKSTDFGQTWNILAGGLPNGSSHERIGLAISQSSPNIIYALYSTSIGGIPELYVSYNSGSTWSLIVMNNFDPGSYGSYGWYFGKIYVDPNDPDKIFIPAVELQCSSNGGQDWNICSGWDVHADGHYMYFKSSGEYIYCTDGGLYKTYDNAFNWIDIENIPNNQFYSITEDINNPGIYAGGVQDNGTMYGNASTFNNYTEIYGGDGFCVAYTHDPLLIYSESQSGNIVFDDNFPGFFQGLQLDLSQNYNWFTPYFVSSFTDDIVYVGGQRVMRIDTAPYGMYQNISPVLNDPNSPYMVSNISTVDQSKIDSAILYAGTADGKVWNTLNSGNQWNDITPFQGANYYVTRVLPSPNSVNTIYVTRSGYRSNDNTPYVFKSINNGSNWTDVSGDLPQLGVNDIEIYPGNENVMFVANDAGVYQTINGGVNWERLGDKMPFVAVLDIQFNYNRSRLIAGTFGRSIYTIDMSGIIPGVKPIEKKNEISIYPNPATDKVFVKTNSKIEEIRVFDMNGKLVLNSKQSMNDISILSEGSYLIDVLIDGRHVVKKFMKD